MPSRDVSTNANYSSWRTRHTVLDCTIDFVQQCLIGKVGLTVDKVGSEATDELVLDTSFLNIDRVDVDGNPVSYEVRQRKEPLGSPLVIRLPADAAGSIAITIHYSTTARCTALQWLDPPYVFSQCQAIHARSMFPCQDTPSVKSTYEMKLRSPFPVVATGNARGALDFHNGALMYVFDQPVPIPSYLCAIASGDLAAAQIGPRSTVYREPRFIHETQMEMAPVVENFIAVAESFLPAYAWTSYNVLILPQSFPYGGMENPQITFATPTILSGDGSNLDVIIHELAHSWSGNLVTAASWAHFYLNEGWTVWLERKILEKLHGRAVAQFSALIGWRALEESVANFGPEHEFTKLLPDLDGQDPDDAFSSVPYEKGFNLLYEIENLVGSAKFEPFVYSWFSTFAGNSVTTDDLQTHLSTFFAADADATEQLQKVDWQMWLHAPGLPKKPDFDLSLAQPCYALADAWCSHSTTEDFNADDIAEFDGSQRVLFLETLTKNPSPLFDDDRVQKLDEIYNLTSSRNAEVLHRFLLLALRLRARPFYERTADFLGTVGRMKYVRTLFRELNVCDAEFAKATFNTIKSRLHPICRTMVARDLGIQT
ncbi:Leucyl aminopeptidase yscIV [Savitreella phatthalungensis]